jgi:hypothetical protein
VTPRRALIIAIPSVALVVLILTYFQLFSSTFVVLLLLGLYVLVSLRNRKKFSKQKGAE